MGRDIKKGSTDQSTTIRILDSTTFLPEEAVDYDTSGLSLWYRREGGAKVAITPAALASLETAHTDGGIEHEDDGYYRLDLPDAAVASGANEVQIGGTVTGMVVIGNYHALVDNIEKDTYDRIGAAGAGLTEAGGDGDHLVEAGGTGDQFTAISGVNLHSAYDAAKTAAQAGDNMNLADDAITASKFDETTAFPLASADSGATAVARTGADSDTLETLSDQLDAVPTAAEIQAELEADEDSKLDNIEDQITAISAKMPSKSYLTGTDNADGDIQLDEATGEMEATISSAAISSIAVLVSTDAFQGILKSELNKAID